jgi:RNA polymerase sigma factor (sigma-70 family)
MRLFPRPEKRAGTVPSEYEFIFSRTLKLLRDWFFFYSTISGIMQFTAAEAIAESRAMNECLLDPIELFNLCAAHREDSAAWTEFLRRYTVKIKHFIHGAVRQTLGGGAYPNDSSAFHENDLFQNIIIRLVENDCAAMKRFSGTSENALLAYLAVICRSTVLDELRHSAAYKRRRPTVVQNTAFINNMDAVPTASHPDCERTILMDELMSFARTTANSHSGNASHRDQLVFQLHFFDGLSHSQIARCQGINLSKAGVEKLLHRLVERVQFLASSGRSKETLQ